MSSLRRRSLVLGCSITIAVAVAVSQDRGAVPAVSASHIASGYKPTNLKVLPKDIAPDELDALMHQYQRSLGESCEYCHAENTQTKQIDYASDANPMKSTARIMISMTNDINTKYLAEIGDRRYAEPITCGNCHRGRLQPPVFDPKP